VVALAGRGHMIMRRRSWLAIAFETEPDLLALMIANRETSRPSEHDAGGEASHQFSYTATLSASVAGRKPPDWCDQSDL
jgi:hypothetical protein